MDTVVHTLSMPKSYERRASVISEVRAMETSYQHMLAGLQGFSKYVPVPVVVDLVHPG